MSESIDLTPGKEDPNRGQRPKPQVPPPAQMPPGVTGGNPPLPVGRAVKGVRLTDSERNTLKAHGWEEGDPV